MINIITRIKELESNKGKPFNSINLKKARRELTKNLLKLGKEILEVENYVLKINYVSGDKSRPYTAIYTKESYKNYQDYKNLKL